MRVAAAASQGWLFQRLRWRLVRNAGTQLFGNSRMRLVSMLLCSVLVWFAVFGVAYYGFGRLVEDQIPPLILELLFNAMFVTLGGMLVFSTGLVLYAGLFTSAEARFLLATPARADQVFAMKFQSAVAFSSWAFVVLGGPILIAYGIQYEAPWYFYLLLPVFFLGFVLLPGGAGGVLCLLFVNFFPHRRKQALATVLLVLAALLGYWLYHTLSAARAGFAERDKLQGLFDMFTVGRGDLSPSDWMARGLLSLGQGEFAAALRPMALLWSNGLMLYVVAAYAAKRLYRRGFNRMATGGDLRHRYGGSWADRVVEALVFYLDRRTRILIVKDFRTFRREPAQVGQLVIFTGLLLLAVVNSRQFFDADIPAAYQQGLSLLNMGATGLLMCAYLGRFIYPLISLEGRKFWILGLLPLKREQILWGKFAFAVTGSVLLAGAVVLLSDVLLQMPTVAVGVHLLTVVLLGVGLSGLSVGLSAWLPNFRETDASKIVLGFGGTVNMLVGLGYLVLVIAAACGPFHAASAAANLDGGAGAVPGWAFAGLPVAVGLAAAATVVPMRVGGRHLRTVEF
jgi:ABC-2 type transport system permease protein